jgi:hypothetical protein
MTENITEEIDKIFEDMDKCVCRIPGKYTLKDKLFYCGMCDKKVGKWTHCLPSDQLCECGLVVKFICRCQNPRYDEVRTELCLICNKNKDHC